MNLEQLAALRQELNESIGAVVHGQEDAIDLLLVALLADGHVLLEGVPGTAKTLLARSFARALNFRFQRAQFTPDLMPTDLVGVRIFDFRTQSFALTKGPIFTEVLLADELNRTPPKTQAALLEAMAERRVSIADETHSLGEFFFVIATQNPIEMEGTYPLPEAQIDRFLFRIEIGYPPYEAEQRLLDAAASRSLAKDPAAAIAPLIDRLGLAAARSLVREVQFLPPVRDYLLAIIRKTREHPALRMGASPRAGAMLAIAAKAAAALRGFDFVSPDDLQGLCVPALAHRLVSEPRHEMDGLKTADVLDAILAETEVPK